MLRTLLIVSVLLPGCIAALCSPYYALLVYLWFAMFRPLEWIWVDITGLRLSLVLGVVLLGRSLLARRLPNVSHPLSVGMLLFVAASVLAQLNAVQPDVGWTWTGFLVRLVIVCLLLVTLATEPRRLWGVVAVIASSLGFHAAKAGLVWLIRGGDRFADGLAGALADNNGYALGTAMIVPLLVAAGQNTGLIHRGVLMRWAAIGFYVSAFLSVFAIIGTYSRGGFISLVVGSLTFVLLQRRRAVGLATVSILTLILLGLIPIPSSYVERLQTIRTYEEVGDESATSRWHFWRVGIVMGIENPLGVGLRQFEYAYDDYDFLYGRYGSGRAVHSSHLQVFAETGVLGAAVWLFLLIYSCVICFRVRKHADGEGIDPSVRRFLHTMANALLASLFAFIVGSSFLSLALNDLTWLTFGMIAALHRISVLTRAPQVAHLHSGVGRQLNTHRGLAVAARRSIQA